MITCTNVPWDPQQICNCSHHAYMHFRYETAYPNYPGYQTAICMGCLVNSQTMLEATITTLKLDIASLQHQMNELAETSLYCPECAYKAPDRATLRHHEDLAH